MSTVTLLIIGIVAPFLAFLVGLLLRRRIKWRRIDAMFGGKQVKLILPLEPSDDDIRNSLVEALASRAVGRYSSLPAGFERLWNQMNKTPWLDSIVRSAGTFLVSFVILAVPIYVFLLTSARFVMLVSRVVPGIRRRWTLRKISIGDATFVIGSIVVSNVAWFMGTPLWLYGIEIMIWFGVYQMTSRFWIEIIEVLWGVLTFRAPLRKRVTR